MDRLPPQPASAILRRARAILTPPAAWCRGELALDAAGLITPAEAPAARQWCALGAIRRAAWEYVSHMSPPAPDTDQVVRTLLHEATVQLALATGAPSFPRDDARLVVACYNDTHTHPEILALFDAAIARQAAAPAPAEPSAPG